MMRCRQCRGYCEFHRGLVRFRDAVRRCGLRSTVTVFRDTADPGDVKQSNATGDRFVIALNTGTTARWERPARPKVGGGLSRDSRGTSLARKPG